MSRSLWKVTRRRFLGSTLGLALSLTLHWVGRRPARADLPAAGPPCGYGSGPYGAGPYGTDCLDHRLYLPTIHTQEH